MIKIGLIINPMAGVGGPVALKGSDGADIVAEALRRGAKPRANQRARQALEHLSEHRQKFQLVTFVGAMGGELADELGFQYETVGKPLADVTTADDTRALAQALVDEALEVGREDGLLLTHGA